MYLTFAKREKKYSAGFKMINSKKLYLHLFEFSSSFHAKQSKTNTILTIIIYIIS